jgi:hypothetical protein
MPQRFRRLLPLIIRSNEGGSGALTSYADYAAVQAVQSSPPENPHFFSIDYNLPYFGEGSCKGVIVDGRITLFDFLPIVLFDSSFYSPSPLANTGVSIDIDADNLPTFTKTSGNSSGTTDVFIVGTTAFQMGQRVEIEIYHEDSSASGDRLFGAGVSLDGVSPIKNTSGDMVVATIYRSFGSWSIYQTTLTTGFYSGFGQINMNDGVSNDKFNPGKVVRLTVGMKIPYEPNSLNRISFLEDGETEVESGNLPASSALSPSNTKTVNIGIYMYSYTTQASVTKLLRIRIQDMPQYVSQPSYPTYP